MKTKAYFDAIQRGDVEEVERLLAEDPGLLEARTRPPGVSEQMQDCTGLHAAVYAEQPAVARLLVASGIDIEARTSGGRTALHDSIEFGIGELTDLLLERGAELDICSAAILGRLNRVGELLNQDPELVNDRSTQLSPLGWAAFGNQVGTATELIERGARMDDGELLCAASVGHVEVGRHLIERGADPDEIIDDAGGNALHVAASMKYTTDSSGFVRMLLENGADPSLRSRSGKTALEIAEARAAAQAEDPPEPPERPKQYDAVVELLRAAIE